MIYKTLLIHSLPLMNYVVQYIKHTAQKNKKIKRADRILSEVYGTTLNMIWLYKYIWTFRLLELWTEVVRKVHLSRQIEGIYVQVKNVVIVKGMWLSNICKNQCPNIKVPKEKRKHLLFQLLSLILRFYLLYFENMYLINKGNNKITELRTILQRESQNS
jgi:hypothetical protein